MEETSFKYKICILGEAAVGKTSLIYRFIEDKFKEDYKSTLGVNLLTKEFELENYGVVGFQIWDLGGQDSFKRLRKMYLEGSRGALIVFDVTKRESFEKIDGWVQIFKEIRGDAPIFLIGNKIDLKDKIKVEEKEAQDFAKGEMGLILTSAKTGENVDKAFHELAKKFLKTSS